MRAWCGILSKVKWNSQNKPPKGAKEPLMTDAQRRNFLLKQQAPPPPMTNDAIRNELLEALFTHNNSTALKILFYIAKQNIDLNDRVLTLTIDSKNLMKITNTTIRTLKTNIKALQKVTVTFISTKDNHKVEEFIQLIPQSEFIDGVNKIKIDMYKKVYDLIVNVEKNFSLVDLDTLLSLNNKNTIRTLMILERINNFSKVVSKRKTYDLDELNGLYGTNYKRMNDFVKNIIIPSQEDLQSSSSQLNFLHQVNYLNKGKGRPKAVSVTIDLVKNQPSLF